MTRAARERIEMDNARDFRARSIDLRRLSLSTLNDRATAGHLAKLADEKAAAAKRANDY